MADIFSRTVGYGGAFSADGAVITFGSYLGAGMLAQSIQWSYMQDVKRIYEIGSNNVFLVAGRTVGQASVQRVMGPTVLATTFYSTFGNVCNAASNSIVFSALAKCGVGGSGTSVNVGLYNCVIQSYGGGVAAQDMVVNEQISMLFLWLTYGT
jgi:hypothetical protein